MPWKESTVMSQKEEFIRSVETEAESFSALCAKFGISRKTGYKILNRFKSEGLEGLKPHSRMPLFNPNKTPQAMVDRILEVRAKHTTWGPRKILTVLQKQRLENLPAPSTVSDILKRHGFISEEASKKRQAIIRFERSLPNELWQMDFKGHFQLGIRKTCYPLTILDDHSRFSLCLHACQQEDIFTVKKQLIRVFEHYGPQRWNKGAAGIITQLKNIEKTLPFSILGFDCDNGTEFLNWHLLRYLEQERKQKVQFARSRPYKKNDNAHVERKKLDACASFIWL